MKKGFTIIELLAVIIILGVLSIITVPVVIDNVNRTREASFENLIDNIENTTELYVRKHKELIPGSTTIGNTVTITLQDLVDTGDLKPPLIDKRENKEISLNTQVSILVKSMNKYEVTVGTIIYTTP
ncbi:MAG: prepilin-type N-terminal cleavage/methylation domain-containing protein [Bacilli bacterium]|nr:prepilin-type N-terminal cleavage/methylation domain-containing protein [Bacilli bacterium]MDD3305271.1 prepilin-type N-terminal cleavage/methylation domain-containing protein [Bacilli bacterium]MDD4053729.1 prepilin-type N-terminal cleavage/methylation domain-containing protein [Bacilli bacterium]MDD4411610.1 prepilin-type N-terminal cleavage/methylation domain-containing protein [Bacilli bacterium]